VGQILLFSEIKCTVKPIRLTLLGSSSRPMSKGKLALESIRYVLSQFEYDGKNEARTTLIPDPNVVMRYYRFYTDPTKMNDYGK
jgi:hypothetical protein